MNMKSDIEIENKQKEAYIISALEFSLYFIFQITTPVIILTVSYVIYKIFYFTSCNV